MRKIKGLFVIGLFWAGYVLLMAAAKIEGGQMLSDLLEERGDL